MPNEPEARQSGQRGAPGRTKRLIFWVITLSLPFAMLLLALEGGLRLASPSRSPIDRDTLATRLQESEQTEVRVVTTGNLRGLIRPSELPGLIYELKPSRHWVFQGAETATNSHGMRGGECSLEKPAGTLRVAGLGDSVMFGWGVGQGETYMSRLQRRLSGETRPVQVLNFAVPGYNASQEAAALREKVLRYSPDLLLVHYNSNDWVAPFFVTDPNLGSMIESSLLLQNIRERLVPGVDEGFFEAHQGMARMRAALRRIGEDARRHGVPVLFYLYPHPSQPGDQERAERLARDNGFVYVDLFEPFAEYQRRRQLRGLDALNVGPDDPHPNAEAHGLIAEVLEAAVEAQLQERGPGRHAPRVPPPS